MFLLRDQQRVADRQNVRNEGTHALDTSERVSWRKLTEQMQSDAPRCDSRLASLKSRIALRLAALVSRLVSARLGSPLETAAQCARKTQREQRGMRERICLSCSALETVAQAQKTQRKTERERERVSAHRGSPSVTAGKL